MVVARRSCRRGRITLSDDASSIDRVIEGGDNDLFFEPGKVAARDLDDPQRRSNVVRCERSGRPLSRQGSRLPHYGKVSIYGHSIRPRFDAERTAASGIVNSACERRQLGRVADDIIQFKAQRMNSAANHRVSRCEQRVFESRVQSAFERGPPRLPLPFPAVPWLYDRQRSASRADGSAQCAPACAGSSFRPSSPPVLKVVTSHNIRRAEGFRISAAKRFHQHERPR